MNRMNCRLHPWVLILAAGLAGMPVASAQVITGQITGRVTDPSGAVVPGVEVSVLSGDTGLERKMATNADGYYTAPLLPSGRYQVAVRHPGFRPVIRSGIDVRVDQIARIDFALEVGAVTEALEVKGSGVVLETESAAVGTVVGTQSLLSLPLSQRNSFQLTLLVTGVQPPVGGVLANRFDTTYGFSVNGGRPQSTEVLIDGISNTTTGAFAQLFAAITPPPDSLQEFKIQTSAFAAEFGRSGGGIVNMVMKSGTNEFHGSAREFFQNSVLNANGFFSNKAGSRIDPFKRSQFGATLGGPVKKNKLFFFFSWESLREGAPQARADTVPSAKEKRGDFSSSAQPVGGVCTPVQIYDPVTTRLNPSGSGYLRDPFPGAVIPASRLDRVGANVVSYYPLPNTAGAACSGANNFYTSMVNAYDTNQIDAKADYMPTDKNHTFVGVSWFGNVRHQPNHWGTIAEPNGYANNPDHAPARSARIDYTRVVSPTFLLNFRGGVVRWGRVAPNYPLDFNMSQLGFAASLQPQMTQPVSFPWISPSNYTATNRNITYIFQHGTAYTLVSSVTWIHGKHNFKFGGEHRIQQDFENTGFWTSGQFNFDRTFTQGPNPNVATANAGNSIASLLLGVGSGNITKMPSVFTSNHYTGLYAQDSLKLTSRLTVELGVRYELETPRKERYNKLSYWDYNTPSPLSAQVPSLNLRGGLRFVGPDASAQFNTDYNNFGPRLGLAYTLGSKTVVRTGYGLFYTQFVGMAVGSGDGMNGYLNSTQWVGSLDSLTPFNYLSNGFPNGLIQPTGSSLGLLTNVGQQITGQRDGPIDRNSRVGYMQSWTFNIQQELKGILLETAYIGTKGTKLGASPGWELNQLPPQSLALGTALQQLVPNPFYGIISTGPMAQPTIARSQLLRPYPQFLSAITWWPAENSSIFHSFQFRAQKNFSQGIGFLVSYTNSKLIDGQGPYQDAYNRRADRSLSTIDNPQRLVASVNYVLPIGKGKTLGGSWPSVLDAVAGNWRLNSVVTLSAGWPLAITASNVANLFNAVEQANVIGDPNLPGGRSKDARLSKWFNTAAFQQPAPFTLGNGSRTLPSTRTDGVKNIDFSVFKSFPWKEQRSVEFRAEMFNFFNHPQFAAPGTAFGSGTFGVVSAQANSSRQVQLALKVLF